MRSIFRVEREAVSIALQSIQKVEDFLHLRRSPEQGIVKFVGDYMQVLVSIMFMLGTCFPVRACPSGSMALCHED